MVPNKDASRQALELALYNQSIQWANGNAAGLQNANEHLLDLIPRRVTPEPASIDQIQSVDAKTALKLALVYQRQALKLGGAALEAATDRVKVARQAYEDTSPPSA